MRKKIFILLFFFSSFTASPQDIKIISHHTIDSLQNLISTSDITDQITILNTLASYYAPFDFDTSIMYASQAIRLATVYSNTTNVALVKANIGNAYYYKMDFKNALLSYLSALKILEENNEWKASGDICLQLGNINFLIRRSEKAISYYHKALGYYQASGDEISSSAVYEAMSLAMDNLNYKPKDSALIYGNKLLKYSQKINDHYREALAYIIIGQIYLGDDNSVIKKQKALAYNDSALIIATKHKYDDLISIIYLNLGCYYDRSSPFFELTGDLALSQSYFGKAYTVANNIGSSYLMAMILNSLANIDIEERKYAQAEIKLNESEARFNNFFQFDWKKNNLIITVYFLALRERNNMYNSRFKLAMAKGEYKKAVEYLNSYYLSRDTMNAAQQVRQLELLMAEADAEKTDQKIRLLSQENELNRLRLLKTRYLLAGAGSGIFIFSLFLLLFFQRKRFKAEQKSLLLEQKLLRSQMNPHFIFNSLASIQNFVINENSDQASIYLSRFSNLIRNILDNSIEEYVPLEKEISTIENYLELQKVRFAGQFEWVITVNEMIDDANMLIPPMLAQPFIENAIEHGIRHRDTKGHIDIRFHLEEGLIRFEVEDDGVGRVKSHEIEAKHKPRHRSMATSLTRDRLNTLNKKLKYKIRLEIIDLTDSMGNACGTKVTFGIPVLLK
ncbi:MAG: histidine kinase [Bacteroidetes bacterium]|nr:histidine kinase [Bacteroidota bacterium]MBL6943212.1 histidine kinase [Bacteroidales bacterium]